MLDYEITGYKVEFKCWSNNNDAPVMDISFDAEEKAVEFIKSNRHMWTYYILTKTQVAIIDF